ncbi:MAG: ArsR/SmtB family transcription factor [Sulfuriferula sp.]
MITETAFFDALADETRRRILALLLAQAELCVCELHVALDLHQPKVSRHLSVLRDTGILTVRREGTWIYYRLNPQIPAWGLALLALLGDVWTVNPVCQADCLRLLAMENRPLRCCA